MGLPALKGQQRRRATVYVASHDEGLAHLRKVQEVQEQIKTLSRESTLQAFLRIWVEIVVAPSVSEKCLQNYNDVVELHLIPRLGPVPLKDLKPEKVSALFLTLELESVSPATQERIYEVLSLALGQAVAWEVIERNPCKAVAKPKSDGRVITILDDDQVIRLIKAAENSRLYALYVLGIFSGLRLGELFGIKWRDIDWERQTITVRRSVSDVRGRVSISQVKTKKSVRTVELPVFVMEALALHQRRMRVEGRRSTFVFVSKANTLLSRANFHKVSFKPLLRRAKLPNMAFHDLRHNATTILLRLKVHAKVAAARLGHANIATTLDVYSHLPKTSQAPAVKVLEEIGLRMRHGCKA